MAFTEIADLDCSKTTALGGVDKKSGKKNPVKAEGYYIGTKQVANPKSKTGFGSLHVLQTQEGNLGIWGKTNLDQKMSSVKPGQMIEVTFVGMVETKNNPMYKYRVRVDANNTIEVASAVEASEDFTQEEAVDLAYGDEEDSLDAEEASFDEAPVARATPPARAAVTPDAARQAKVKALLNGTRSKTSA